MKKEWFISQMGRLADQFRGAYQPARLEALWSYVKFVDDSSFEKIVTKFLGECRQAPLIPEFCAEMALARERSGPARKAVTLDPNQANCKRCSDTGVFPIFRNGGCDAFRCDCELGRQDRRLFPIWAGEQSDLKAREVSVNGF